tara:strand:- start:5467 stop:6108 length:642 start_codon:yes stop_codon:yes gene_type:complete
MQGTSFMDIQDFTEFDQSRLKFFQLPENLSRFSAKRNNAKISKEHDIREIFPLDANIVDAGCGVNPYKKYFPNLIGFDFVDYGNQDYVCKILDAPIELESQDGVLCLGVLHECPDDYHLPNIEKMLSWLRPGGLLIMRHKKETEADYEERRKQHGFWIGIGSWPRSRIDEFTNNLNVNLEWIVEHSTKRTFKHNGQDLKKTFDGHIWCWRKYV